MPAHFYPPNDATVPIWRYMDFTKFISMLDSSELFLAKSTSFDDQFEGTLPTLNRNTLAESNPGISPAQILNLRKAHFQIREMIFISCWHASRYESEAMWKLYSNSGNAVAICSNFETLEKLTPTECYVGEVQYIDYDTDALVANPNVAADLRIPFMHKRKAFEHEKEIRAVAVGNQNQSSISYSIELSKLIKAVYVSPISAPWFELLVSSVVKKYDFDFPVIRSQLSQRPNY